MGELADRLLDLAVTATSPDGQVSASVQRQGRAVEVSFRPAAYRRYREAQLAHQLNQLATLTFTRYRRQEDEVLAGALGPASADGIQHRRYRDRLARLVAKSSGDGIRISSRGLVSWEVTLASGLLRRMPEPEFVTEMVGAVARLLDGYTAQALRLKDEIFDLGYPERLRRMTGLVR
jgi:hypothetical protein